MRGLTPKFRLLMSALGIVGLVMILLFEFGGWHNLDAVTLNDESLDNWESSLGLQPDKPILKQPVSVAANRLLQDDSTVRVDIEYDLPSEINITTNRFEPVCFLLDNRSGRVLGLNHQGRVVPVPPAHDDWERPVLTSIKAGRLFQLCDDPRVAAVIPQLTQLAEDNVGLFRLIDEIDFSASTHVTITISGLPYTLKAGAAALRTQLSEFIRFIENYQPNLEEATAFDLRYADMIIQGSGR